MRKDENLKYICDEADKYLKANGIPNRVSRKTFYISEYRIICYINLPIGWDPDTVKALIDLPNVQEDSGYSKNGTSFRCYALDMSHLKETTKLSR